MGNGKNASFNREFFARPTVEVAREILGASLVRTLDCGRTLKGTIIEVEAYTEDDPACHAYRGATDRCRVMFGEPGFAYVYFIYGVYFCLNVVTEPEGTPGAVLIRAIDAEGANGPGKLCREWQIDREMNGIDLLDSDSSLKLLPGIKYGDDRIGISTRIGLSVGTDRMWRFYVDDHPCVSGKRSKKRKSK